MNRRGGRLVFAATIGNMLSISPVVLATFGLFLIPIATDLGWPRSVVSAALAAAMIGAAIGATPAGRIADRFGSRRTILAGNLLFALSVALIATVGSNPAIFFFQFLIVGLAGAMASGMVIAKLLADSFDGRRGFLIGIAGGIGNGVGAALLPVIAGIVVATYGWRDGYVALGATVLIVGFPILYFFINSPAIELAISKGIEPEGASLNVSLKDVRFWLLATSIPVGGGCLQALFATITPILSERGISIDIGTTVIAIFALTCAFWEPGVGFLLDKAAKPLLLAPCYASGVLGVLLLLFAQSVSLILLSGVFLGIALGAEFSALTLVLSRYFGRRELGAISGIMFGIALFIAATATVLLNICFDVTGSYRIGLYILMPLLAWNSLAILGLPRYTFAGSQD